MRLSSLLLTLVLLTSPACADSLTGKTPANTYKGLLQVPNSNNGVDGSLRNIQDGNGTDTPLRLSTSAVDIASGFQLGGTAVTNQALDFLKGNGLFTTPTGADTSRLIEDIFANRENAANYGVKCDGLQILDIDIANGNATATSQNANFDTLVPNVDGMHFELTNSLETTTAVTGTVSSHSGHTITLSTTWTGTTITNNIGRLTLYTTDNTTKIQAGLDALRDKRKDADGMALKGNTLVMPPGICVTGPLTQHSRQLIEGQGHNATSLFLKSGSNAALITSDNFATLSVGNLTYGNSVGSGSSNTVPTAFGLKDIQIEGNKAGNKTGTNSCVDYYGAQMILAGTVEIGSCDYNAINWMGSTSFAYDTNDRWGAEEGRIDNLFIRNWTNYGFRASGIHDTWVDHIVGYSSQGSWGVYLENNGTIHANHVHIYATSDGKGVYLGAAASIGLAYADFAMWELDNGGIVIGTGRVISAGYQSQVAGIHLTSNADNAVLGNINCASMYSGAPSGAACVKVDSGADGTRGTVTGAVGSAIANTTLLDYAGNFGIWDINFGNFGATGDICLKASGTLNHFRQTTFGCKTAVSYTAGGNNTFEILHYHSSGETDWSGALGLGDKRYRCNTASGGSTCQQDFGGHVAFNGSAPTVSSCGTTPSISGSDGRGTITTGTGSPTACTITFNSTFESTPVCTVTSSDATVVPSVTAISASAATIGLSAGLTSGKLYYHCIQ